VQRAAADHRDGPLLLIGGPGTGKTQALAERAGALAADGAPPESILVLAPSRPATEDLRDRIEAVLDRPAEGPAVTTPSELCARLLREHALELGLDPFAVPVARGDRLALLLDRTDELELREHDLAANPSAMLAGALRRIDALKAERITATQLAAWADRLPENSEAERALARREREFAALYRAHDRILAEAGAFDSGELVLRALRLLDEAPHVRARLAARYAHVLVDDLQDLTRAQVRLVALLGADHGDIAAAADDDQAIRPSAVSGTANLREFATVHPTGTALRLDTSLRCPAPVLTAAAPLVADLRDRDAKDVRGRPGGEVAFWRAANERAQAQAIAADIERLINDRGVDPEQVAVVVGSARHEAQAIAGALEERSVPHRLIGAASFFGRAEVRDLLAWLRLLIDPSDMSAVVRAVSRPPIELRSVELARCIQIARRRKLDMVSALVAATESPQIPPEARDRILVFLKLYRAASSMLDTMRPDLFVHRLVDRLGLRRQQLFSAQAEVVERLVNLARFGELAAAHARRVPQSTAREFARHIAAVADAGLREEEARPPSPPSAVQVVTLEAVREVEADHVYVAGVHAGRVPGPPLADADWVPADLLDGGDPPSDPADPVRRRLYVALTRARERVVLAYPEYDAEGMQQSPAPLIEAARKAVGGTWQPREEELFGPDEFLHATFRARRDELLATIPQVGRGLGELRFDTDLDVTHAVVRYLELLKLAALIEQPPGADRLADQLDELNARIIGGATSSQREILETSPLDEALLEAERGDRRRAEAAAAAAREQPTLQSFLPRRGAGLMLSASDIDTYRACPLRYKFARVFRIPQEPTVHQRFGIVVHQVLERYHTSEEARTLEDLLGLLDFGWRRGGFGDTDQERQLRIKAENALRRYHARFEEERSEPVWFERSFAFRVGEHQIRGRVDRVDRLPEGGYELIDYKTGRPKPERELKDDVQLSVYAVAAREAWDVEAVSQAYYHVLDDVKVAVERDADDRTWIEETVGEVADAILAQEFEPTPSVTACSMCDYRLICPAAER
jgi:DNA helicase-2/ATP-dependent DNA helicase PcrA